MGNCSSNDEDLETNMKDPSNKPVSIAIATFAGPDAFKVQPKDISTVTFADATFFPPRSQTSLSFTT